MDNAFHDCSAQCWLHSHTALSPRNKEPQITLVHSGHSRQLGKWSFLSGWKKHKLIAVISFLSRSPGRLMAIFFPSQMPAGLPLWKLYVLHCTLLLPSDMGLHPYCQRIIFCHWVETSFPFYECESLTYQEHWRHTDLVFLFFWGLITCLILGFFLQIASSHTN